MGGRAESNSAALIAGVDRARARGDESRNRVNKDIINSGYCG